MALLEISALLLLLLVRAARRRRVDRHRADGLRLRRHAVRRRRHPGRPGACHHDLGQQRLLDARGAAAVHLDGRDPVPHAAVGGDVPRASRPGSTGCPGRLLHVNVLACGIFGSVSGSSAATCATVAKIALPELKKRGYDEMVSLGSLAGAGTLGILIPPSITMVVYAVAANVSIIQVFLAGLPAGPARDGALLRLHRGLVARATRSGRRRAEPPMPLREKLRESAKLIPLHAADRPRLRVAAARLGDGDRMRRLGRARLARDRLVVGRAHLASRSGTA